MAAMPLDEAGTDLASPFTAPKRTLRSLIWLSTAMRFTTLKTGSSESLVVNGNVTKFRITRNVVHDNNNIGIDVIGFERTAHDPAVDQARDGLVSENVVYNITSRRQPGLRQRPVIGWNLRGRRHADTDRKKYRSQCGFRH